MGLVKNVRDYVRDLRKNIKKDLPDPSTAVHLGFVIKSPGELNLEFGKM